MSHLKLHSHHQYWLTGSLHSSHSVPTPPPPSGPFRFESKWCAAGGATTTTLAYHLLAHHRSSLTQWSSPPVDHFDSDLESPLYLSCPPPTPLFVKLWHCFTSQVGCRHGNTLAARVVKLFMHTWMCLAVAYFWLQNLLLLCNFLCLL